MNRNSMPQWINLPSEQHLVNRTQLSLLCQKSGAILLVLVGLMAGRQAGRQSDEMFHFTDPVL